MFKTWRRKTVKEVKLHIRLVCAYKSQDFKQIQEIFARSHDCETVTFRNSDLSHSCPVQFPLTCQPPPLPALPAGWPCKPPPPACHREGTELNIEYNYSTKLHKYCKHLMSHNSLFACFFIDWTTIWFVCVRCKIRQRNCTTAVLALKIIISKTRELWKDYMHNKIR